MPENRAFLHKENFFEQAKLYCFARNFLCYKTDLTANDKISDSRYGRGLDDVICAFKSLTSRGFRYTTKRRYLEGALFLSEKSQSSGSYNTIYTAVNK